MKSYFLIDDGLLIAIYSENLKDHILFDINLYSALSITEDEFEELSKIDKTSRKLYFEINKNI